jgi:hypothetical protein
MNVVLWILQVVLALKFLSVTVSHGLRPNATQMAPGVARLGSWARPVLILTAVGTFLAGVALVLPAALGVLPALTPLSAAALALMMLAAIALHARCREDGSVVVCLVLLALAAFVAYGRWAIAPF